MADVAAYTSMLSIGFLVVTTLVMLWFAFTDQGVERAPDAGEDADAEAEGAEPAE